NIRHFSISLIHIFHCSNFSSIPFVNYFYSWRYYQNKRGGKVQLQSMIMPFSEFDHAEKGDALYAMELALSLEKMNNEKLLNLHRLASENNDAQFVDFLESQFLVNQVEDIKKISEYVAQLRRVGTGHGVWHFDQMLQNGGGAA
ncbi:ferritin-3, chloroplastic-like, partial [Vigna unguiculata]|uniref:ferritin-3, chloroplastic-like n=1 Tax=Vigna unguiculata TaxID=3917 RepID=UPI0010162CD0